MDKYDDECCWICLGPSSEELGDLVVPCQCKTRSVHAKCLARWQLWQAGKSEETHCRFCSSAYGDWRATLTPRCDPSSIPPRPATPIMAIFFEGQIHRIKVHPGPEGRARFEQQIRELIQLEDDEEFTVEFECKAPDSGHVLHLDGISAFDAATHCAALTAAERINQQQRQQQQQHQVPHVEPQMPQMKEPQ